MGLKIGVDGGGTKTELIIVGQSGEIVHRLHAPGCNPSVVGPTRACEILCDALRALTTERSETYERLLLCMAGSTHYWRDIATSLSDFGRVDVQPDSLPALELATDGRAGIVLHGGTGSFVAARGLDGAIYYAGGLGWRLGDLGSGYDLGRRALASALLEIQGWMPTSVLTRLVQDHFRCQGATEITRSLYSDTEANTRVATLAPGVLQLASAGDKTVQGIVLESVSGLLDLALHVAAKLFPLTALADVQAGLTGPILTHPLVVDLLSARSLLALKPVRESPIEGVRRLLCRTV